MKYILMTIFTATMLMPTALGNCRTDCRCLRPEPGPMLAYDLTQQFNEKRYWIEQNERTGAWQVCWQRLGLHPEFFDSTTMFCFPAKEITPPADFPTNSRCWRGNNVIFCQEANGRVKVHHPQR